MTVSAPPSISNRVATSGSARRSLNPAKQAEIALLLSTYQKPWHLERVLASIAMQVNVLDKIELVVTDDGSTDETADIVVRFAQKAPFPVRFTTHPRSGFQLARCRNEGVLASTAPYLLFLDGDCVLPPDHVWRHLSHRQRGEVMGGYCVRLDRELSERIDVEAVQSQSFLKWIPRRDLRKLTIRDWKARFYRWLRHPHKPKLAGNNIGLWRDDYERVNGYDENFIGWGGEDDDLRRRLVNTGVRVNSILRWTCSYHLWHPPEPSVPTKASQGRNFRYLTRRGALTRCRNGLRKRSPVDLDIRLAPHASLPEAARSLLETNALTRILTRTSKLREPAEIELGFYPGISRFSESAECRLLVALSNHVTLPAGLLRSADIVLSDQPLPNSGLQNCHKLVDFAEVVNSQAM